MFLFLDYFISIETKILFFCFDSSKKVLFNFDIFRFIHFFVVKNKISYT